MLVEDKQLAPVFKLVRSAELAWSISKGHSASPNSSLVLQLRGSPVPPRV